MSWWVQNVPVIELFAGVTAFLLIQGILLVRWLTKLDDRIFQIERNGSPQVPINSDRISRLEERTMSINFRLGEYSKKIDSLDSEINDLRK